MNQRRREDWKKRYSTPLTKWQIFRGFLPLMAILGVLGYYFVMSTDKSNLAPLQGSHDTASDFGFIWIWAFKTVFLVGVAFEIGRWWMQWYRTRNLNEQADTTA